MVILQLLRSNSKTSYIQFIRFSAFRLHSWSILRHPSLLHHLLCRVSSQACLFRISAWATNVGTAARWPTPCSLLLKPQLLYQREDNKNCQAPLGAAASCLLLAPQISWWVPYPSSSLPWSHFLKTSRSFGTHTLGLRFIRWMCVHRDFHFW